MRRTYTVFVEQGVRIMSKKCTIGKIQSLYGPSGRGRKRFGDYRRQYGNTRRV